MPKAYNAYKAEKRDIHSHLDFRSFWVLNSSKQPLDEIHKLAAAFAIGSSKALRLTPWVRQHATASLLQLSGFRV